MFTMPSFCSAASRKVGPGGLRCARRRCAPRVVALEDRALLSTSGGALAPHPAQVQAPDIRVANASGSHALAASEAYVRYPGGFVFSNPFGAVVRFPGGSVYSRPRHTHVRFPGGFVNSSPFGTVVQFPGGSVIVP